MLLIIITVVIFLFLIFNVFVYKLGIKIQKYEQRIMKLFDARTNQTVGIYQTVKDIIVKPEEIFEEFFNLKRRDFFGSNISLRLSDKVIIYSKIHNEINFIFKICEQHQTIKNNPLYVYFKESIQNKSTNIGNEMKLYKNIKQKHDKYKIITKFMIIGFMY